MKLNVLINVILLEIHLVYSAPVLNKYVKLTPLKYPGLYTTNRNQFFSYYLSPSYLEIIDNDDNYSDKNLRICDVMPLPFSKNKKYDSNITPATSDFSNFIKDSSSTSTYSYGFQSGGEIVNKDGGLYDNLPYKAWSSQFDTKKQIYNYCNFGININKTPTIISKSDAAATNNNAPNTSRSFATYSHAFENILLQLFNAKITRLYVDIVDQQSETQFQLGAALVLSKQLLSPTLSQVTSQIASLNTNNNINIPSSQQQQKPQIQTKRTTTAIPTNSLSSLLSSTNPLLLDSPDITSCVVNIHIHELINLACDLKLPIHVDKKLYQSCCIDASLINLLSNSNDSDDDDVNNNDSIKTTKAGVVAMMIDGRSASTLTTSATATTTTQLPEVPITTAKVWEIYDHMKFTKMNMIEKRALLRDSGITDLPRPREGMTVLDALLMDYMDSAVRDQYNSNLFTQQQLVSSDNDENESSNNSNSNNNAGAGAVRVYESPRQLLLQQMAECLEAGNTEKALQLRDEFARLTQLRADPTQSEGSYDKFLDQDDWYMKARRKSMK